MLCQQIEEKHSILVVERRHTLRVIEGVRLVSYARQLCRLRWGGLSYNTHRLIGT